VRVHVLNATLEQAFSTWHTGFRSHVAARPPHSFSSSPGCGLR
jgi:hypothetical protein